MARCRKTAGLFSWTHADCSRTLLSPETKRKNQQNNTLNTNIAGWSNGRIRCFEHRDAGSTPAPAAFHLYRYAFIAWRSGAHTPGRLLAVKLGSEPSPHRFDSCPRRLRLLCSCETEGIRLDEEAVLKTVAVKNRSGFESLVFRSSINLRLKVSV